MKICSKFGVVKLPGSGGRGGDMHFASLGEKKEREREREKRERETRTGDRRKTDWIKSLNDEGFMSLTAYDSTLHSWHLYLVKLITYTTSFVSFV